MASLPSPLKGKRVVITRSVEQAEEFRVLLEKEGAIPIEIPTIEFQPPPDPDLVKQAIERIDDYHIIIFTSANAVRFFLSFFQKPAFFGKKVKVAAIGLKTASVLRESGFEVDIVPEEEGGSEELYAALVSRFSLKGKKILFPRALKAREFLPNALEAKGAHVDVVPVYQTVPSRSGKEVLKSLLRNWKGDWITFASSSAARSFFSLVDKDEVRSCLVSSHVKVAALGRETGKVLEGIGIDVAVIPETATLEALIRGMKAYEQEVIRGK